MRMKPASMLQFPLGAVAFAWHVRSAVVGPWATSDNHQAQMAQEQIQQMVRSAAVEHDATEAPRGAKRRA